MSAADPMPFAIRCPRVGEGTVVVIPTGGLDLASAPKLRWTLFDLLEKGRSHFVVDLSHVSFIDSTALGVLISFKRILASRGRIVIAAPGRDVVRLLEVAGVMRALDLFPTAEAAVASLKVSGPPGPEEGQYSDRVGEVDAPETEFPAGLAGDGVEGPTSDASLTPDAAIVLGIAASAMPFARSSAEQAERWLRILCRYGDSAVVLAALGITDELPDAAGERAEGAKRAEQSPERPVDSDPVATVTRCAELATHDRGASGIRPSDLLQAVMSVYGPQFEHVLMLHGVESADVIERLRALRPD
jgi:anti-sigma B factor antagonist